MSDAEVDGAAEDWGGGGGGGASDDEFKFDLDEAIPDPAPDVAATAAAAHRRPEGAVAAAAAAVIVRAPAITAGTGGDRHGRLPGARLRHEEMQCLALHLI